MTPSPGSQSDLSAIARGGGLNLAGSLVAGASSFVVTVLVTNGWDAETAGLLFSVTSIFLIMVAVALLGTDTALARFVLGLEARGRSADAQRILRSALRAAVGAAVALGAALVVLAPWIVQRTGLPDASIALLRLLGLALPLAVVSEASLAATRAYGVMRTTVVVDRLVRCGTQVATVALAAWLGTDLLGLAAAWAVPYLVAAVLAPLALARLVRRRTQGPTASAPPPPPAAPPLRREFWQFAWPRALARICQVGLQRSDIVLVAALRSPREAALYTAATRFVVIGQMTVQAVQQVLQPRLARLLALEESDSVREVYRTTTAWIVAMAWPVYLTSIVAAPLYLGLFGEAYVSSGQLVVVLVGLGMLLATAAGPVDVLLLMSGRSGLSLFNNVAGLGVNVALNLMLIPVMGIDGAALSWAVALAVRNVLPFHQVHRSMGLHAFARPAAYVVTAGIGCFLVPMGLLRMTAGLSPVAAGVLFLVQTLVYGALLWRARALLRLDMLTRSRGAGTPT